MFKKARKSIKYILSLILAAVLVYFAFRGIDWAAFVDGIRETRWGYVLLFFVVSVIALVFREERWKAMMEPLDPDVKRIDAWDASNVGNLVNTVLPGAGEFLRGGYVSSKKMNYDKVFGTVVCERAWDVLAVAFMLLLSLLLHWDVFGEFFNQNIWLPLAENMGIAIWLIAALVIILIVGFIWFIYHNRNRYKFCIKAVKTVKDLWEGIASFAHIRKKWSFIFYTIGIWVMYVLMTYFTFKAIPALDSLTMVDSIFISSIGNIASVIPVPGGMGAYHYLVALSLQQVYGVSWETGILNATLGHELHALLIIVLGIISYTMISIRKKKSSKQKEDD